jgi:hypothetical protein
MASPKEQAYRYDSAEDAIQCLSCASPFDSEPKQASRFAPPGSGIGVGEGAFTANAVPEERISSDNGDYVFFETTAPLVPQDIDGEAKPATVGETNESVYFSESSDVYEWRRNGVDGCAHVQGCVALITNGRDGFMNVLLGTTPSGEDVFFATHSRLASQDVDSAGDVYDARVGGGFPPPPPRPVECEGDACSTPAGSPNDLTPSSLVFTGAGNILPPPSASVKPKAAKRAPACPKGKRVRRGCRKAKAKGGKRAKARGRARAGSGSRRSATSRSGTGSKAESSKGGR